MVEVCQHKTICICKHPTLDGSGVCRSRKKPQSKLNALNKLFSIPFCEMHVFRSVLQVIYKNNLLWKQGQFIDFTFPDNLKISRYSCIQNN